MNKLEIGYAKGDPRFRGDPAILRNCNFMGATSNNPHTKADKLFAHHLPFQKIDEEWIRLYIISGFCGPETGVYYIKEMYLEQAMKIAKSQEVDCEPSGIAGLALMLQLQHKLPKDKKMLVINTGKTRL